MTDEKPVYAPGVIERTYHCPQCKEWIVLASEEEPKPPECPEHGKMVRR